MAIGFSLFFYFMFMGFMLAILEDIRARADSTKDRKIAARLQFATLIWPVSLPIGVIVIFIRLLKNSWKDAFNKED